MERKPPESENLERLSITVSPALSTAPYRCLGNISEWMNYENTDFVYIGQFSWARDSLTRSCLAFVNYVAITYSPHVSLFLFPTLSFSLHPPTPNPGQPQSIAEPCVHLLHTHCVLGTMPGAGEFMPKQEKRNNLCHWESCGRVKKQELIFNLTNRWEFARRGVSAMCITVHGDELVRELSEHVWGSPMGMGSFTGSRKASGCRSR